MQNCLSELFSHGHLAADLGIKTVTAGYRTLKGMKHNEYKTKTNTLETPRLSRETHLKFHFVSITQLRQVTLPYVWVMLYEKKGDIVARKIRLLLIQRRRLFELPAPHQVGCSVVVSPANRL